MIAQEPLTQFLELYIFISLRLFREIFFPYLLKTFFRDFRGWKFSSVDGEGNVVDGNAT
jgi:hypothetical protein